MSDDNARRLIELGDKLFSKKGQLDTLWQTLDEHFNPMGADFTATRIEGDDYAGELYESVPAQNRRELAGAMGAILRPRARKWFKAKAKEGPRNTELAGLWLGAANDELRAMVYSRRANFQVRVTEGDEDFVTYGNAVHSITEDMERTGTPVFDTHHLRDCAWAQDRYGAVNVMHRKFKIRLANFARQFGADKLPQGMRDRLEKDPFHEIEIRHICVPGDQYDGYTKSAKGKPFASLYVEPAEKRILKEGGYFEFPYWVRRWRVRRGSAYGYSPAAMLGLVEARLLQSQARVIMDAGERAVDPAMIATQDAVLGEVNTFAGAMNWVSADYDEKLGQALRPLESGGNLPIGLEMKIDTRNILAAAWYLNKLTLPSDKDMTAYEVSERISEYIRSAGPIFEPFETDNAAMLEVLFGMGLRLGRFGPIEGVPRELQGGDIEFEFDTPIQLAYARQKVAKAQETVSYAANFAKVAPDALDNFDFDALARDGAEGIDGEANWVVPAELVMAQREARARQQQALAAAEAKQKQIATMGQAAALVPQLAAANQAIPEVMAESDEEQPLAPIEDGLSAAA